MLNEIYDAFVYETGDTHSAHSHIIYFVPKHDIDRFKTWWYCVVYNFDVCPDLSL